MADCSQKAHADRYARIIDELVAAMKKAHGSWDIGDARLVIETALAQIGIEEW